MLDVSRQGILIGLAGTSLDPLECELLRQTATAGCVLFSRNFIEPEQLKALVSEIRAQTERPLLIAVDHEGGRVQRFRQGFTHLPPLGEMGKHAQDDLQRAMILADSHARLMSLELLAMDIDMSLAPVADVDGGCEVIGDRALHQQANIVAQLCVAYIKSMRAAGMASCAKHFPGHGCVEGDSHLVRPRDERGYSLLQEKDLLPFVAAIGAGVDAMMMSHVVHPQIDDRAAGFSFRWVNDILRQDLGFSGVVMSDDLAMEGAASVIGMDARVKAGFDAGCNLMLACKPEDSAAAVEAATRLGVNPDGIPAFLAARVTPGQASKCLKSESDKLRRTLGL